MSNEKRVEYIDIARGIAMLCIIMGHLGNRNISRVVFTFHVPIFFLITGYLMSERTDNISYVKKKFRNLIVPYIVTCIVIIVLGAVEGLIKNGIAGGKEAILEWGYASIYGAGDSYTEPFYIKQIGAIWFLWATFWGSLFLKISVKLKENIRIVFILLLFLSGYFSRELFWFPLSIQAGCCATLFMYIGHVYKKNDSIINGLSPECKKVILLFATIVWLFFIKDFKSFWLVHCDIGRGIIDIFGCLCACYVVFQISKYIEFKFVLLGRFLAYIGKYSIFMLCIHIIELNLFPWWRIVNKICQVGMLSGFSLPLVILGKFVVNILGTYICSKWKFTRMLFGFE